MTITPPPVIYLQNPLENDGVAWSEVDFANPCDEVTWCRDQINDSDLIYKLVDSDDKTAFGALRRMHDRTLTRLRDANGEIARLRAEIEQQKYMIDLFTTRHEGLVADIVREIAEKLKTGEKA